MALSREATHLNQPGDGDIPFWHLGHAVGLRGPSAETMERSPLRSIDPNTQVAPHDSRRTFAKLAHKGRAALEQIQLSLDTPVS